MKKIFLVLIVLFITLSTYAQNADLVYVDGWVDIKSAGGTFEAFAGDSLKAGDSVITQDDSFAELQQMDLSSIKVNPNSIFTIREVETDSGRETVLTTTVGSVSFKFGKLFGKEPKIATPSMVAGIRGTELTVYAGEDGSTLIAVNSGLVTVESQGVSVDLVKDEGVEVLPGEVPGEKFSLLGRELDFSSWNAEKYDSMIADPIKGLERLGKQMDNFVEYINEIEVTRESNAEKKEILQKKRDQIKESEGEIKANAFYKQEIEPLVLIEAPMYLNIRYHTLSSLSFRRYIIGKLYLEMKSKYIMDTQNSAYKDFLSNYYRIIDEFEIYIVPYMNPMDL
jgi:FecR protein